MVNTEPSTYSCKIRWQGDNRDYETFLRVMDVALPGGAKLKAGGAHKIQDLEQTNPEELFAASVGTCMMMTILAVFSKAQIVVTSYEDSPEALLEFVDRRFRVTKVTLRPRIKLTARVDEEKLKSLVEKSHANCFVTLSVKSEVLVEPVWIFD
jgi:organic hydroperoxide reductase OsmC/OhrA